MSVDLSVENGLAEIVLNRPDKMNALNDAMVAELNGALERAASQGVRAMMIRGEGPAFSAGRDLADAHPGDEDAEAIIENDLQSADQANRLVPGADFRSRSWRVPGSGPRPRARMRRGLCRRRREDWIAIRAYRCGTRLWWPFVFRLAPGNTSRARADLHWTSAFRRRRLATGTGQSEHAERFAGRGDSEDRGAGCTRTDRSVYAIEATWCAGSMKRRWACSRF